MNAHNNKRFKGEYLPDRGSRYADLPILPFVFLLIFLLNGCATIPDQRLLADKDEKQLRQAFKEMVANQQQCPCCLDATANIHLSSLLFSGQINGFIQAMSPSYVKFVGINPLGQPIGILTCNGQKFRYVDVMNSTVYDGDASGTTFKKYAPTGLTPAFSYYWLIGRLQPGPRQIIKLSRDQNTADIWVELRSENGNKSLVLFDPRRGIIRRHLVLDEHNEQLLNILYDKYGAGPCPFPGLITITSLHLNSSLEISLRDFRPDVTLKQADFTNPSPPSFANKTVE